MKPTMLTLSLCLGLTILGCAYGPMGPVSSPPAEVASTASATGQLVIKLAAPAGRTTLAFAEDVSRIEVTLRRHHDQTIETVGQATLKAENGWKFDIFNLLPGTYDMQLIVYDRGYQAVQITEPAPYQTGTYEIRAYEVAVASLSVPLKPSHVVTFEYPTPKPSYKPVEGPALPADTSLADTSPSDSEVESSDAATPTPTPTPTSEVPSQPEPTTEGGDS